MGKYNSSIYRVRPFMEHIENDYNAFLSVLSLVGITSLGHPHTYHYDKDENCKEKQLKPTKKHLLDLIDYMTKKKHTRCNINGKDRADLFFKDADTREAARLKARSELEENYDKLTSNSRKWYIFEGFTNPDIFIEGDDYVIICEGKWTEPHITTKTTYLCDENEHRNQMIRHIQGALNYKGKKVYAFYIVDANCGYISDLTKVSFRNQLDIETIRLEEAEKDAISDAFYGYTTWQDINKLLPQIKFLEKSNIS